MKVIILILINNIPNQKQYRIFNLKVKYKLLFNLSV